MKSNSEKHSLSPQQKTKSVLNAISETLMVVTFLFFFRKYPCRFYYQMKALCNMAHQQKSKPDTYGLLNINICVWLKRINNIMLLESSVASE